LTLGTEAEGAGGSMRAYPIISPHAFGGRGWLENAGFLDRLRQPVALTPTLSQRVRGS